MEARFTIFESTLTGTNYRVVKFRFLKKNYKLNFLKIFEKTTKKAIPRKLQRIEQSYLEARFAIFESTLTGTNYRVGNFRFLKNNFILNFLKIFEKITKKSYLENYKELSSQIWRQESQSLIVLWQYPTTGLGISDFAKKINITFLKTLKKNTKNVVSRKLQGFEQSYLEARFVIP